MNSDFLIIADRGNLKAFRVEDAPGERMRIKLVEAITLADVHLSAAERFTDEAGGFPTQTGGGSRQTVQGNSTAERHYDVEDTRRAVRLIAEHIETLLRREKPELWSFAAPPKILEAVIERLELPLRESVAERLALNLVNMPPEQVLGHFSKVRPAAMA